MRRVTRQQTRNEKQDQAYQQAQQTIRPSVVRFTQPASTIPPISAYPLQPAYSVSQRPVSSSQIPGPSVYFPGGFYQHYPSMMDQASPSQYVQQMGISTPSISSGPLPAPVKDHSRKSLKKITEAEEEAEVQTALAPLTQQFPDFLSPQSTQPPVSLLLQKTPVFLRPFRLPAHPKGIKTPRVATVIRPLPIGREW